MEAYYLIKQYNNALVDQMACGDKQLGWNFRSDIYLLYDFDKIIQYVTQFLLCKLGVIITSILESFILLYS